MKRLFDILFAATSLVLLFPILLLVAAWIKIDSTGPVFFRQKRVGRYGKDFSLYKFRSMVRQEWDEHQLITVGDRDPRVTSAGYFLRRYKIDELPQLINVFLGQMSIVGPRPLVRQQAEIYPQAYAKVVEVKPGITCRASIIFSNEDALLGAAHDPEKYFAEVLMPVKIRLNTDYVDHHTFWGDMRLILETIIPCLRPPIHNVLTAQEMADLYPSKTPQQTNNPSKSR